MRPAQNMMYARRRRLENDLWEVRAFRDDTVADGTVTEADVSASSIVWSTHEAAVGLVRVEIGDDELPGSAPLWFVHVDEPRATPRATNLVAFGGDRFPPGTVVSRYAFATAGVQNGEQAGAVRWYPGTGLVHQIFVPPAWRRRFVASTLLYTADAFHQANGWPGKLHGDGRRTALGQLLLAGLRHPNRVRELTEEMPPMDEIAP
jgi:hypothetical protein